MTEGTWQDFLNGLVKQMPAAQKKRFYDFVKVSRTTVLRWRNEENTPDPSHVQSILDFFEEFDPDARERLLQLMEADPNIQLPMTPPQPPQISFLSRYPEKFQQALLNDFIVTMLRLQRDTPDPVWQLSGAILRQALNMLSDGRANVEIWIVKCMPPQAGKVRSLRLELGMGPLPSRGHLLTGNLYLGAESLVGRAVALRHGEMCPNLSERHQEYGIESARSAAVVPILTNARRCIAGALLVLSSLPEYFSPEHLSLIEIFADVIRLALQDSDYVPQECIDLGVMPPCARQVVVLDTFQERVLDAYKKTREMSRDREKIEGEIRRELEDELLRLGSSEENPFQNPFQRREISVTEMVG